MTNNDNLVKLNQIASADLSKWQEKAAQRELNKEWLEKSAKIAIKILRELRTQEITQKTLADQLNVSSQYVNKLVKGQENLSLETICKIEKALQISLI